MSKRVLLTGAGGFVGSHTLRHLLVNTDWHIICLDSFRHKGITDRITQQLKGLDPNRITVMTHDLRAPMSVQMIRELGGINYVISMASESHVDRSILYPRDFIENNVQLVLTLLEYARKCPVEKFIQVSTDEVFGPATDHNHAEGEPHRPSNPYSASKAAQEDICYAYWRTYDLPIIISNTMNIFGELQDPEKYVPNVLQRLYRGEKVTIHASKDGVPGSRFYLHARNQADALLFMLQNIDPWIYGFGEDISRYNVVGEREVSNLEMAELIAKYAGKDLQYELVDFHTSRPGHDLRYALDGTKLADEGWQPPLSFEDSLETTIKWTMENATWLD